jgi:dUTPase
VAQLLFVELPAVALADSEALDDTARGAQGFGSSGSAAHGGEGAA